MGPHTCRQVYVWHAFIHDTFIRVTWRIHTWHIHMCDMTHSYRTHSYVTHSYVRHDAFICVTWRIHMCDMTHSYVWHDSFIYKHDSFRRPVWIRRSLLQNIVSFIGLFRKSSVQDLFMCLASCMNSHSYMWHDSFIYVTWLIHICNMTHSYMWHDSFICHTWIHTGRQTHEELCRTYELDTCWSVWHFHSWCNTLQTTLQHTATHCNTLQHTATHCNTLQYTLQHTYEAATWPTPLTV